MEDSLSAGDFPFSVKAPRWVGYSYMVGLSLPWPKVVDVVFCIHVLFRFLLFSLLLLVAPDILYHCRLAVSTYMVVSLRLPYTSSISNMPDFYTKITGFFRPLFYQIWNFVSGVSPFCICCIVYAAISGILCSFAYVSSSFNAESGRNP